MWSLSLTNPRNGSGLPGQNFLKVKAEVHRQLVEMLNLAQLEKLKPERLRHEVRVVATQLVRRHSAEITEVDRERLIDEVINEAFGLGPLEALMNDPSISDILVNGPRNVWVERRGRLEETGVEFNDDAHVIQIIQRISARIGRRVDEMSPLVDARLPDGSRVNAII